MTASSAPEPLSQEPDLGEQLGFVVVEWNQASHRPSVVDYSFTEDREIAEAEAQVARERTAAVGRRERHTVAVVMAIAEDED